MKETHKFILLRVLVVACGYTCLALAGLSTYFEPNDPVIEFLGLLNEPWKEWTILAILLFTFDMFVLPKYKHLFFQN